MPTPHKGEKHDDFISRCMGDSEANKTFLRQDQRYAFCESQWERHHKAQDESPPASFDVIHVPPFAHLCDYFGPWSCEPLELTGMVQYLRLIDLKAHIDAGAEPLRSALSMDTVAGKRIATINLRGVLMRGQSSLPDSTSTAMARRDIRQAAADPEVAGIMLSVTSPGGTVDGTYELANEIRSARRSKPVRSHVTGLGASAAYWALAQSEHVTMESPLDRLGSIGTVQVIHDMSGAAEKAGVKTIVVSTGPLKGMGIEGASVSQEQIDHIRNLVENAQTHFDKAVMTGRQMSKKELDAVRHGGVFMGQSAIDARLADGIVSREKAYHDLAKAIADNRGVGRMAATDELTTLPMRQLSGLPMLAGGT